ncbi:MAG TPA: glycosyltransferase family 9 protein [Steroidobacteraceae bacterium]|nr:glycosyltransferase family 9 protein [Steroidobacteraceae bacterium]
MSSSARASPPHTIHTTARAAEVPPLVMRCGAFGDMVLLTVLLQQLHLRFGKPVDVISSGPWTQPLLEAEKSVGRLFLLRSRRTPYWLSLQQQQLVRWLRERGSGPTWFCDRGEGRRLLSLAGIPDDYVCDVNAYKWEQTETFADRYLRLGSFTPQAFEGLLPPAKPGIPPAARLTILPQAWPELDAWLGVHGLAGRPFVIIHPGSRHIARRWLRPRSGTSKYWPEANWAKVVRAVREERPGHAILFSGTRAEWRFNAEIIKQAGVADAHNVADGLSVRTLLALLQRADSLIAVDTGPAHAAAALGCPTVALFGTASPCLYRPGGTTTPAVALTGRVEGEQNILGITPEAVIQSWRELLESVRAPAAELS